MKHIKLIFPVHIVLMFTLILTGCSVKDEATVSCDNGYYINVSDENIVHDGEIGENSIGSICDGESISDLLVGFRIDNPDWKVISDGIDDDGCTVAKFKCNGSTYYVKIFDNLPGGYNSIINLGIIPSEIGMDEVDTVEIVDAADKNLWKLSATLCRGWYEKTTSQGTERASRDFIVFGDEALDGLAIIEGISEASIRDYELICNQLFISSNILYEEYVNYYMEHNDIINPWAKQGYHTYHKNTQGQEQFFIHTPICAVTKDIDSNVLTIHYKNKETRLEEGVIVLSDWGTDGSIYDYTGDGVGELIIESSWDFLFKVTFVYDLENDKDLSIVKIDDVSTESNKVTYSLKEKYANMIIDYINFHEGWDRYQELAAASLSGLCENGWCVWIYRDNAEGEERLVYNLKRMNDTSSRNGVYFSFAFESGDFILVDAEYRDYTN